MAKKKKNRRKISLKTVYLIKQFMPYFKKYKWVLLLDLFCATLTCICEMVLPLIIRYITNTALSDMTKLSIHIVCQLGLFYMVLRIIDTAANYFMQYTGHIMGAKIETNMRSDLFAHLQKLSFSYYDETKIGQIMARMTSDLFDVTEFAHHCPEEYYIAFIKIVVSFIILCHANIALTLIIFAIIPVMLFFSMTFNKRMKKAFQKSRFQIGEINARTEDSLLGIRVVKSFANEEIEKQKFEKGNQYFLGVKKEMYRAMAGFQSTTRLFDGIMYVAVLVIGTMFMIQHKISSGDLVAYLLYITTLLTTVRRIVEFTEQFQRGMTGIERFLEVMDVPAEIVDNNTTQELQNVKGDIQFDDVTFRYEEEEHTILSHVNIHIKQGETVALVGPSGSGKSTMCSLIPRFYDVTEGSIKIDGKNIKDVSLLSLRSQIGIVQQDVYLFSGTVGENIAYGKPSATQQEIEQAAKKAGAHEFIQSLAQGYDTYVGERGIKLSGGQKQRISIARVFLKNPPILILDEATSALDNESEKIVQKSLEELAKGRTTLTIAHRLTTVRDAKKILVLTERGIEEQGSHKELIQKGGIYAKYYEMYQ